MKTRFLLVTTAALLLGAPFAFGAQSARAQLEQFSHDIHALSCNFTQQVVNARGVARPEVHGTLALATPNRFRWHTREPEEQLIVADGSRVWIYDPLLEQVTVRAQSSAESHSPLTILTDLSRLDDDYDVTEPAPHDGLEWLRLEPKNEHAQFQYVALGLDDGVPRKMIFADNLGGESRLTFHDWQRNPDLAADTFEFTPPEGAAVVGDAPRGPQIRPLTD